MKTKKTNYQKHIRVLGGTLLIILLDHLTKWFVMAKMQLYESIVFVPHVFALTYVQNIGAGFSLLQGQRLFLSLISLTVVGIIIYFYKKIPDIRYVQTSVMLLLGGTIGNGIERITRGYVVDFIHVSIWPKFNIADTCIVLGGIGLAYYFWKEDSNKKETKVKKSKSKNFVKKKN